MYIDEFHTQLNGRFRKVLEQYRGLKFLLSATPLNNNLTELNILLPILNREEWKLGKVHVKTSKKYDRLK